MAYQRRHRRINNQQCGASVEAASVTYYQPASNTERQIGQKRGGGVKQPGMWRLCGGSSTQWHQNNVNSVMYGGMSSASAAKYIKWRRQSAAAMTTGISGI